jgi:ferredoxin-NADP reductase/rubredoxin/DMSO/TMAO reductase YedYZ heme-binding membrane subunit
MKTILFLLKLLGVFLPGILLYILLVQSGGYNIEIRASGKIAFCYLVLALLVSPWIQLMPQFASKYRIVLLRKFFGLASFYFFLFHFLQYGFMERTFYTLFTPSYSFGAYILKNLQVRYDAITGIIAGIPLCILWITSNTFSQKLLGSKWKQIQTLAYPLFLLTLVHIAFASRFDIVYMCLTGVLVGIRSIAYFFSMQPQQESVLPDVDYWYVCEPCWYIYNEQEGDKDSGILPGTKFEDIPDDWRCPVCGVTKSDFKKVIRNTSHEGDSSKKKEISATIKSKKFLTDDVIELTCETSEVLESLPWQSISCVFTDDQWIFRRTYSLAKHASKHFTCLIHLTKEGRGGRYLRAVQKGVHFTVSQPFGTFVMKNHSSKKVFLATGTGIAPLFSLISSMKPDEQARVFFGVRTQKDIFYLEQLKQYSLTQLSLYLSQESEASIQALQEASHFESYHVGRINTGSVPVDTDTEYYICGNTPFAKSMVTFLQAKKCKYVFSEIF